MSFGTASSRRGSRPPADAPCPCGGGAFARCCRPILEGEPAATAEQLMRSRYTAFVLGDAEHLERSWDPLTRPDEVAVDRGTRWTGLTIIRVEAGGRDGREGTVEFTAAWDVGGRTGQQHELSSFRRVRGLWVYRDGRA